jgi:hypothetical protein
MVLVSIFGLCVLYWLVSLYREKPRETDPQIWDADPAKRAANLRDALALHREGLTFGQAGSSKDPAIRARALARMEAQMAHWRALPAIPPRSAPPAAPRRRATPREFLLGYRDPPGG